VLAASTVLPAQEQERVVRGLSFVGNKALDDYTLESAIATTKSSAWARYWIVRWLGLGEKRYFNEVEFRRDVVRLILLYRQSGYMNAVVDTSVRRTARDVYATFRIHEGDPVRVARLDVRGVDGIFDVARLKRELPLQVGDPFNRFLMQASADSIVARLRNSGYPYAEVLRNFDSEAGILKAEVELDVQPGPRMRIGEVEIGGLRDVDTGTVRRVTSVRPGNVFNQDALYQTQRDLYGIGVFNSVNVILLDSIAPQGPPTDSTVRVLVQVAEGPRHQVRFGGGYGSVEFRSIEQVMTLAFSADAPMTPPPPPSISRVLTPPSAVGATVVNFTLGLPPVDSTGHSEFQVNGLPYPKAKPYLASLGETQLWVIKNDTKWDHPFHLHGYFFMAVDEKGEPLRPMAWKDTINVPINQTVRVLVKFDERPGTWMFHCHILDHADAGMMGELVLDP